MKRYIALALQDFKNVFAKLRSNILAKNTCM